MTEGVENSDDLVPPTKRQNRIIIFQKNTNNTISLSLVTNRVFGLRNKLVHYHFTLHFFVCFVEWN
jgi:hypothetical protein